MKVQQLNFSQRIVLVIALGAACYIVGVWVTSIGSHGLTGWVAYAPLTNSSQPEVGGLHAWVRDVLWLLVLVVWTGLSLALLRTGERHEDRAT
ncbi:MAG: hypothetical protein ACYCPT_11105 [Acidimicrobiales bacterium]